jgi:hypothetical protein
MVLRLVLSAVLVAAAPVAAPAGPDSSPAVAFASAAARSDVPRDLLVSVGWVQSRLDQGASGQGHGIMQLTDAATLPAAAALTGLSRAELRSGLAANVAGAAAVLRSYADQDGLDARARADVNRWFGPLARFSGAADPAVARLFADTVYAQLADGFAGPVPTTARPCGRRPTRATSPWRAAPPSTTSSST